MFSIETRYQPHDGALVGDFSRLLPPCGYDIDHISGSSLALAPDSLMIRSYEYLYLFFLVGDMMLYRLRNRRIISRYFSSFFFAFLQSFLFA